MPKGFLKTVRSGSRAIMVRAPAASAASIIISSFGSRQTGSVRACGVTQRTVLRIAAHVMETPDLAVGLHCFDMAITFASCRAGACHHQQSHRAASGHLCSQEPQGASPGLRPPCLRRILSSSSSLNSSFSCGSGTTEDPSGLSTPCTNAPGCTSDQGSNIVSLNGGSERRAQ
jgi:hypothetical protein